MKTIKNIAGFVCISLLLSGCVDNYDIPSKTAKGKAIYNSWHKGVDTVLSRYVDVAFKFNAWYEAADSQKNSVEDKYFPQFKIRNLQNDQWGLFSGAELAYRIYRNNKSLSDLNACWIIEAMNETINGIKSNNGYEDDYYYSDGRYKLISFLEDFYTPVILSAMGVNQWDIQVGESHSEDMISIQLKSMDSITPASLSESSFTVNTEGTFVYLDGYNYQYGNIVYIDFKTTEDLVYRRRDKSRHSQEGYDYSYPQKTYYWSAGKVSLQAIGKDDETFAEASFSRLTRSQFGIYITYKGITEEWIESCR